MIWLYLGLWLTVKYAFLLWVFFLAVMKLRDIRDVGALVGPIKYPAYAVLGIGWTLDYLFNLGPLTVFYWEKPKERTVSERTGRWALTDAGWRGRFSRFVRLEFLKKADKSGGHD